MSTASSDTKREALALDVLVHMTTSELVTTMDYMAGIVANRLYSAGYDVTNNPAADTTDHWALTCMAKRIDRFAKSVQDQIDLCARRDQAYAEDQRA